VAHFQQEHKVIEEKGIGHLGDKTKTALIEALSNK